MGRHLPSVAISRRVDEGNNGEGVRATGISSSGRTQEAFKGEPEQPDAAPSPCLPHLYAPAHHGAHRRDQVSTRVAHTRLMSDHDQYGVVVS